jgi:hypothetical protein
MSKKPEYCDISEGVIDNESLQAIGRIVRASAEIEDILMLHICNLASISEAKAMVLLGRSPFSTKKALALQLAKLHSAEAVTTHNDVFNKNLTTFFKCRNVVAHGTFLGMDDNGHYAFLTAETDEKSDIGQLVKLVQSYASETLKANADIAEAAIPHIEETLQVKSLRERSYCKSLEVHQRDRNKRKSATKPPNPPQA